MKVVLFKGVRIWQHLAVRFQIATNQVCRRTTVAVAKCECPSLETEFGLSVLGYCRNMDLLPA